MKKRSFILVVLMLICSVFCLVGCTGPQGEQGPQGEKGDPGQNGIDGEQGEKGEKGDKGNTGIQGETGPQGEQGPQGEKGDNGKNVEFSVDVEGIKWRYVGDTEWQSLLTFVDLEGYQHTYTVKFDKNGGTGDAKDLNVVTYKKAIELPSLTKEGVHFMGWRDADGKEYSDSYVVTKDTTLTAVFGYEVTLDFKGGISARTYKNAKKLGEDFVADFNKVTGAKSTVEKFYYGDITNLHEFTTNETMMEKWGWFLDKLCEIRQIEGDAIVQYGKDKNSPWASGNNDGWSGDVYYEQIHSGKEITDQTLRIGILTEISAFIAGNCQNYSSLFSVNWASDKGKEYTEEILNLKQIPVPEKVLVATDKKTEIGAVAKGQKNFLGWFDAEDNKVPNGSTITKDMTLHAKYGAEVDLVVEIYESNPVKEELEKTHISIAENGEAYTLPTLTRDNYVFLGWFDGSTEYKTIDDTCEVSTLKAMWKGEAHKITFVTGVEDLTVEDLATVYGSKVGTLATLTREGFDFLGWYSDAEYKTELTQNTVCYGDIKAYAKWVQLATFKLDFEDADVQVYHADQVKTMFLTDFYNWCVAKGAFTKEEMALDAFIGKDFKGKWFSYVGGAGIPNSLFEELGTEDNNYMVDYTTFKGKTPTGVEAADNKYFLNDPAYNTKWSEYMKHIETVERGASSGRTWTKINNYYVYELGRYMAAYKSYSSITDDELYGVPSAYANLSVSAGTEPLEVTHQYDTEIYYVAVKEGFTFVGWVDENGNLVTKVSGAINEKTLKAKFEAATPAE